MVFNDGKERRFVVDEPPRFRFDLCDVVPARTIGSDSGFIFNFSFDVCDHLVLSLHAKDDEIERRFVDDELLSLHTDERIIVLVEIDEALLLAVASRYAGRRPHLGSYSYYSALLLIDGIPIFVQIAVYTYRNQRVVLLAVDIGCKCDKENFTVFNILHFKNFQQLSTHFRCSVGHFSRCGPMSIR